MGRLVTTVRPGAPPFSFAGKRAVVTGGSRGIGRAIAITSTGSAPEWIWDRPAVTHHPLDLEDEDSIDAFLSGMAKFGPIDIVINNAGIHQPQPIGRLSRDTWDRIFRVNLRGPMLLTQHFGAQMKEARRGRIVNIASIAGTMCRPNASAYASSKLGLVGLTRSSAIDLAPYGVLVNAVSPGPPALRWSIES
jgi:3-oxoacyl-[acyl-carrier protein] reductase